MSQNAQTAADDMKARWRPTPEQEAAVAAYFGRWPNVRNAYTVHILHGKEFGVWTGAEAVEGTPGVFPNRDEASAYARGICFMLAKTGAKATCGWVWHRRTVDGITGRPGDRPAPAWSVFEDIMATSGQAG